jgi:outer membrane usher protein
MPLLLDIVVDGRDAGVMALQERGGHLLLAVDDFRKLDLAVRASPAVDGLIDLSALRGLTLTRDTADQRLVVTVDPALLPRRLYDLAARGRSMPEPRSDTGAIFRYDLSATADDVSRFGPGLSGGGDFALDIFTPAARLVANGFVTAGATGWHGARLDSALIFAHPETMTHLIVGDAVSGASSFGRAVRFAGVQWASDYSLRPGLITQPLPAFFGQTRVPATIDVYQGAAQVYQQQVGPGPFELRSLPVLTGGGSATIVTRDVLGRETRQTISLYTDAGLLAPGLESWSLDGGALRTRYGRNSFAYDTPMASGTYRRGLSDTLTAEVHAQAAPGLAQFGGAAEWSFGFGTLAADLSASGVDHAGWQTAVSLHARAGPLTLFGDARLASQGWRDLAAQALGKGGILPPRFRYQLGATADLDRAGTLGLSWLSLKQPDARGQVGPAHSLLSATWSLPLGRAFLALAGMHDMTGGVDAVQLVLNFPLGGGLAGLSTAFDGGTPSGLVRFDDPADPDGGFGYRLAAGWQDGARFRGQADWIGDDVALDGGVSLDKGRAALRAGAQGALVWLRGSLFASHDPGGAVALVETGEKNIRIYRENRPVAVSDGDGEALLTGLNAYAPNHITVEPRDYDFNTLVEKTDAVVVPRQASGVVVDLRPTSRHPFLATVTRGIPIPTPMGAAVYLDGQTQPLTLGRDGQLFVADLEKPRGADIVLGSARCRIYIRPARMGESDPLLCWREAHGAY